MFETRLTEKPSRVLNKQRIDTRREKRFVSPAIRWILQIRFRRSEEQKSRKRTRWKILASCLSLVLEKGDTITCDEAFAIKRKAVTEPILRDFPIRLVDHVCMLRTL
ncbi:hypothetical protein KM043_003599 [Ampulex compressa]|nr:hypothetical protein KM043_003599 [Ampulex compressa]